MTWSASTRACSRIAASASAASSSPSSGSTCATSRRRSSPASRRSIHLAAVSNDPVGDLNPEVTYEINHQASVRLARVARAAGRLAVPLLVLLQPLRRRRRRSGRRAGAAQPGDPVRALQGPRRAGHRRPRRRRVQPHLPSQRDRLRAVVSPPRRPGRQQPRRPRSDRGRGAAAQRRQPVAPAGSHRGHLARLPRRARGRPRAGPQPGIQRRAQRGELPRPRGRRDRPRPGPRELDLDRSRRRPGPAQLPGQLRQGR